MPAMYTQRPPLDFFQNVSVQESSVRTVDGHLAQIETRLISPHRERISVRVHRMKLGRD